MHQKVFWKLYWALNVGNKNLMRLFKMVFWTDPWNSGSYSGPELSWDLLLKRGKKEEYFGIFSIPATAWQQRAAQWLISTSFQPGGLVKLHKFTDRKGLQLSCLTRQKRHFITTSISHPSSSEWEVLGFLLSHSARCWALSFPARQEQPHNSQAAHDAIKLFCETCFASVRVKKYDSVYFKENPINEESAGISGPLSMALALSRNSASSDFLTLPRWIKIDQNRTSL